MSGQWPVVRGGCFSGHWSLVTAICMFARMEQWGYGTEGGVPAGWGRFDAAAARREEQLHPLQLRHRPLVHDIPSIQRGRWLKQQNPAFLLGNGTVLDSARDHDEFAFFQPDLAVAKLHAEAAFDHQKHFVFI